MYASGIQVNSSQSKALVYLTFAALGGDTMAEMTLVWMPEDHRDTLRPFVYNMSSFARSDISKKFAYKK